MKGLNAIVVSSLIAAGSADAKGSEGVNTAHSIKELTESREDFGPNPNAYANYTGWTDREALAKALCDYNRQAKEARGMTEDCLNLMPGAKLMLPRSQELRWFVCEEIADTSQKALCELRFFAVTSEADKNEASYKAIPLEAQKCVDHMRDTYPTASVSRLIATAKGIGEGETGNWSKKCATDIGLNDMIRSIPSDYAEMDSKGWIITNNFGSEY